MALQEENAEEDFRRKVSLNKFRVLEKCCSFRPVERRAKAEAIELKVPEQGSLEPISCECVWMQTMEFVL